MRIFPGMLYPVLIAGLLYCCQSSQDQKNASFSGSGKMFSLVDPQESGVTFSNDLKETETLNVLTFEYFYNGGGVAIGDINQDGLPDIYLTGNQVPNRLYLNKGNMQFSDVTSAAGVSGTMTWSTGVTMADINGDGWLDIYVCNGGPYAPDDRKNELYINQGDLTFTESAAEYGLDQSAYSTQALFVDYDNDNDLDLFLLNRPNQQFLAEEIAALRTQKDPHAGDMLFRNEKGQFVNVSEQAGIHQNGLGYGLGVTASDLSKDGYIDIYVSNDYLEPDYLYVNQGDGTFKDQITKATAHISNFGMGVDIADMNNDAWPDIYVADMAAADNYRQKTTMRPMDPHQFNWAVANGFHYQYMYNTLQLNRGNLNFSEIAQMAGVSNTDWSWATLFADFDNDGWKDLLITNGFRKEFSNKDFVAYSDRVFRSAMNLGLEQRKQVMQEVLHQLPETKLANYIFRNRGDLTFENKSVEWGLDLAGYSNGAAIGDLDLDGDLDLVINNIDAAASVYQNHINSDNYIKVSLRGPKNNSSGIGTKVYLYAAGQTYYQELIPTRGYQSAVEPILHFGGDVARADSLRIIWPDGKKQTVHEVAPHMQIDYNDSEITPQGVKAAPTPWFTRTTSQLEHPVVHRENQYDDFRIESLLPHKMSQQGPALAVGDVDGNGWEDFYIGGAKDHAAQLYLQNSRGGFEKVVATIWEQEKAFEDVEAVLFDADNDQDLDLYVSSGGNEHPRGSAYYQDRLYINNGKGAFHKSLTSLPEMKESSGVVLPYDFDNDGDLDLFVGGRQVPQAYPQPARSYVLQNQQGTFEDITNTLSDDFYELGMVTDALWTNLDNNGYPDLVVVGEWMPIKIYEYRQNSMVDQSHKYSFSEQAGWWSSIIALDYNSDGLQDLVAGNLGLNYKYKATPQEPFQVFYGDYDQNGQNDIILGYFDQGTLYPLRGRQCSAEQMPILKKQFPNYASFAGSNLEEIYGKSFLESALHYEANNFASLLLTNKGGGEFEQQPLPRLAQISNINDFLADDFNSDGFVDLLLAGNQMGVEVETPRNDASRGLLLKGTAEGFEALDMMTSGVMLNGEVKHLRTIILAPGKKGVLVAKNNDSLEILTVSSKIPKL